MYNSIVYGDYASEIEYNLEEETKTPVYFFKNCLVKQYIKVVDTDVYKDCMLNISPKFVYEDIKDSTYRDYNYHLTVNSPVIGKADIEKSSLLPIDLDGNERLTDGASDIGCYEFKP